MPSSPRESGPTAERVAANVRSLRRDRGLGLAELADLVTRLGQPLSVAGLSALELGKRRVDVDDLVALSLALDVSPIRLLLPPGASAERMNLTPAVSAKERSAWEWMSGDAVPPHDPPWANERVRFNFDRLERFSRESAPQRQQDMDLRELLKHEAVLRPVRDAVTAAESAGVPLPTVLDYLKLFRSSSPDPGEGS